MKFIEKFLPKTRRCYDFLAYSVVLAGLFGLAHLLGFRQYTQILSGTGPIIPWQVFCGVFYMLLYLGVVGIVPILLIAAGFVYLFTIIERLKNPRS